MNVLVELSTAKLAAGNQSWDDEDLQLWLDAAHELIESHVKQRVSDATTWEATVDAWTAETAPAHVVAAIVKQFVAFVGFRGDDANAATAFDADGLAIGVAGLLRRFRDPAVC